MIQTTSAWEYVANTKFLLNKSTPYHALNNYLILLIKGLYRDMVSIEKNSEIKKHIRRKLSTFDCDSVKQSGLDRVRGLMSVYELPSNECYKSFLKYCSVK